VHFEIYPRMRSRRVRIGKIGRMDTRFIPASSG